MLRQDGWVCADVMMGSGVAGKTVTLEATLTSECAYMLDRCMVRLGNFSLPCALLKAKKEVKRLISLCSAKGRKSS